jgi:hypothetical protein
MLSSPPDFQELEESVLDFRADIMATQRTTTIIPTGTTGDRTTIILNHIRITTPAPGTPGITGIEFTVTTAIITTIATKLT